MTYRERILARKAAIEGASNAACPYTWADKPMRLAWLRGYYYARPRT
jgi:ribosome modulation factor